MTNYKNSDVHKNLIVSLPEKVIGIIENESQKRDMSKSRFVLRLLEKGLELQEDKIAA